MRCQLQRISNELNVLHVCFESLLIESEYNFESLQYILLAKKVNELVLIGNDVAYVLWI